MQELYRIGTPELISAGGESPERERAAIAALEKARAQEVLKTDKLDRAVDAVVKRIHERRGSELGNWPVLGSLQQQRTSPAAP